MNKLYLLILLLLQIIIVQAQQKNISKEYDAFDLKKSPFYVDPWRGSESLDAEDQTISWFLYLTEGEYRVNFDMSPNSKDAEYEIEIGISAAEGKNFTAVGKKGIINEKTAGNFIVDGIEVSRPAFYQIKVKCKELKGKDGLHIKSMLIETPKGKGGKIRAAKYFTSPKVALRYQPDDGNEYEYDWLYGELSVDKEFDPIYTRYTAVGFQSGMVNLNIGPNHERTIEFMVKGGGEAGIIQISDKGENVKVQREDAFAGGLASLSYPGESNRKLKFLLHARKLSDHFVVYSAWFSDQEAKDWQYVASWKVPNADGNFKNCFSQIENSDKATGQKVRKADFCNIWGRRADNRQWTAFNKAELFRNNRDPENRDDYEGGVSKNNTAAFYISSGGYTNPIHDGKIIITKRNNALPKIDMERLSARVDQAIKKSPVYIGSGNYQASDTLSVTERIYGISKFWQEVNYNFVFLNKIDKKEWNNAYMALLEKALQPQSDYQYYRELQKFCALLKDGHTNVYMPPHIQVMNTMFGTYRLFLENIENKAVVTRVNQSRKDEIPIGSEVIEVNGLPTDEYMERFITPYISASTDYVRRDNSIRNLLQGLEGEKYTIKLKKPDGKMIELNLTHETTKEKEVFPPVEDQKLFEFKWLENKIAYMALNSFSNRKINELFVEKLPELYQAKALIIDVRKNGGGSSDIGTDILQYLVNGNTIRGDKTRSRVHIPKFKAWGVFVQPIDTTKSERLKKSYLMNQDNYYEAYNQFYQPINIRDKRIIIPTAILAGHYTASAAEDFLICADNQKHIVRIGEKSYGSNGQPFLFDLPAGGSARVCTMDCVLPDGREYVGYGILPDIEVIRTVDDLIHGRDRVLEKAVEYLTGKIR